jgi:hypothetical protein
MYGAFGKNNSQSTVKGITNTLLLYTFGKLMAILVNNHGMMAKNRFQFKNRNIRVSE